MATTYTLISSNVLSGSAASVTFSSIPSTFTDLVLRISSRADSSFAYEAMTLQFNSSTATNYSYTFLRGTGSAASSFRASSNGDARLGMQDSATATANTFGNAEIYIPNYAASTSKPFSTFAVQENNNTAAYIETGADLWGLTNAITSIAVIAGGFNFVSGSSFYLYGIKNS